MRFFGFDSDWFSLFAKRNTQMANRPQPSFPEGSPPSYQSLYPSTVGVSRSTSSPPSIGQPSATSEKLRPSAGAKPFPLDWQVSVGPQSSRLRSTAFYEGDENAGRRDLEVVRS